MSNYINELREVLKANDCVFVCIGTDRAIGDVSAPLIGTFLEEKGCPIPIVGTIKNPVHALNIHQKLEYIYNEYKGKTIIALDSCVGEDLGKIIFSQKPIRAGAGIGKRLPHIGDYSIKIITVHEDVNTFDAVHDTRLSFVYDLAKKVSSDIMSVLREEDVIAKRKKNTRAI